MSAEPAVADRRYREMRNYLVALYRSLFQ